MTQAISQEAPSAACRWIILKLRRCASGSSKGMPTKMAATATNVSESAETPKSCGVRRRDSTAVEAVSIASRPIASSPAQPIQPSSRGSVRGLEIVINAVAILLQCGRP